LKLLCSTKGTTTDRCYFFITGKCAPILVTPVLLQSDVLTVKQGEVKSTISFVTDGSETSNVIVEGVKKEDEGKYTCLVENRFASQEASAFLTVTGIGQCLLCQQLIVRYSTVNCRSVGHASRLTALEE